MSENLSADVIVETEDYRPLEILVTPRDEIHELRRFEDDGNPNVEE